MRGYFNSQKQLYIKKVCLLVLGTLLLSMLLNYKKTGETEDKGGTSSEVPQQIGQEETKERQIQKEDEEERIRVLLKTDNFSGISHEMVHLYSENEMALFTEEQENNTCGTEFLLLWEDGTLFFNGEPLSEPPDYFRISQQNTEEEKNDFAISVESIQRNHGTPSYEGMLEIWPVDGGFVLINELPLETYLNYVVPSEMPSKFSKEALKAQAVCARTYAYKHMQSFEYPEYGAHVDDSVIYQVYNNTGTAESTTEAVQETKGEIMTFEGQPITAYYFSTSCGYTGDEELWWAGDRDAAPYLRGKTVNQEEKVLDMCQEDVFKEFIHQQDETCYDAQVSWYRWSTEIDKKTLSEHLNAVLAARISANPEAILTRDGEEWESRSTETIGTIQGIEVIERNSGGAVQKICIRGSKAAILAETEYNVRALLNVQGEEIVRMDGSIAEGGSILPSAYFTVEPAWDEEGELAGFCFTGGGYGHGVGMSQNAANKMAELGKNYEEILKFFYEGVDLTAGLPL